MRSYAALSCLLVLVGACGSREPPPAAPKAPPPPADPAWLAQAAKTCALVASCAHGHDAKWLRDPGACVAAWTERTQPDDLTMKCASEAKSCDDIGACLHGRGDPRAAAFCAKSKGVLSACDDNRLVSCSDDDAAESSVVDCGKLGATCKESRTAGGLLVRACIAPDKCPAGAPEARCDGKGAVVTCQDGAIERIPCGTGTSCVEHADGGEKTASCELPAGQRCGLKGARRCAGDRLIECRSPSHFGTARVTDCASQGLRCSGAGPRAACYVPDRVECDKELLPRCDGNSLVFCAAGRRVSVSCTSIGMKQCGAGRGPFAICTP
ncbi:MAG: hypothetical protein KC657_04590 [Myxococcales bacterium]|nr:hypothetical protein [Myxococcales bacterium]